MSLAPTLVRALAEHFGGATVAEVRPVSGGCISTTLRVRLSTGASVFVKLAPDAPPGAALLEAEAASLAALAGTRTVRVPRVLGCGGAWLLVEWLEPGRGTAAAWRGLGQALARLHRTTRPHYGWDRDNFIGSLAQANPRFDDWAAFWWEARLEPQLARARAHLTPALRQGFERLHAALPALLAPGQEEGPSLLHGDLWSGNVHLTADGMPALIDPASYYGHREVDLAMAALFGGFDAAFREGYEDEWPLRAAGLTERRAVYQLYYLLVHVNLFGAGYLGQTERALRLALA